MTFERDPGQSWRTGSVDQAEALCRSPRARPAVASLDESNRLQSHEFCCIVAGTDRGSGPVPDRPRSPARRPGARARSRKRPRRGLPHDPMDAGRRGERGGRFASAGGAGGIVQSLLVSDLRLHSPSRVRPRRRARFDAGLLCAAARGRRPGRRRPPQGAVPRLPPYRLRLLPPPIATHRVRCSAAERAGRQGGTLDRCPRTPRAGTSSSRRTLG